MSLATVPFSPERAGPGSLPAGLAVVCVGGGTGLATLLSGLKAHVAPSIGAGAAQDDPVARLTAIVTVSDDGGSSGRLREEFKIPPPGDIRNCIAALSEDTSLFLRLFNHRFEGNGTLGGHSFGNLLLTALTSVTGDFVHAVKLAGEVLAIKGTIYPSTCENVQLTAVLEDGTIVRGESKISQSTIPIRSVGLEPPGCAALPESLQAIAGADLIVLGPGSLYTSIVPNLLVNGLAAAVRASKARKVLVCNLMTQTGETRGFTASDHARVLGRIAGDGIFDTVLVNSRVPPAHLIEKYRQEGAEVVRFDEEGFAGMGVGVVSRDLMSATDLVRHEPDTLARAVLGLARG
jgi:uncharacterized cofD-like protein